MSNVWICQDPQCNGVLFLNRKDKWECENCGRLYTEEPEQKQEGE